MSALLLAPYNDSMRLGQGYNSFLQTPCIHNAVQFDKKRLITEKSNHGVSQVVSYTSRFVDKISDVVRSMNISAGSSVKSGYITASGSSLTIDEQKFSSSDLNAVVSIKVRSNTTLTLLSNISTGSQPSVERHDKLIKKLILPAETTKIQDDAVLYVVSDLALPRTAR